MKVFKYSLLVLLLTIGLTSCGDDDGTISGGSTISFSGSQFVSEDDGSIVITVQRDGGIGLPEFNFELSGTAIAGEDYVEPDTTTFSVPVNGETTLEFMLINDEEVEEDKTFIFSLPDENLEIIITLADDDTFPFQNGFLISNEGPFNSGFGSVSFLNRVFTEAENGIYQEVNDDNLGNIVQSIGFSENDAYVVANVSNRITVVDRFTFVEEARIETGLENPRYFEAVNGTGYVTNWGDPFVTTDDYIAIIDLASNTVTGTIPVGEGPERMIVNGSDLYVALRGGFGVNNQIVVIDTNTNTISAEITVGDVPDSMQFSDSGDLWVIAQGSPAFTGNETAGTISRINTQSQTVAQTFSFAVEEHPSFINIQEDDLYYYLDSAVYRGDVDNFIIPQTPEFTTPVLFNMLLADSRTLIACDAGDFASNGDVRIYDVTTGEVLTVLEVGIIPNNIYINE